MVEIDLNCLKKIIITEINQIGIISKGIQMLFYMALASRMKMKISNMLINEYDYSLSGMVCYISFIVLQNEHMDYKKFLRKQEKKVCVISLSNGVKK